MRIEYKYNLLRHNTFRMNVSCECFIEYDSVAELESLDFDSLPRPFVHIGKGSNLLFTGDFEGTVLHSRISHIKYVDMGFDEIPVMLGAGVVFDDFVKQSCGHGLWGAENLSLIPGEVGAAAVQNIGAYGAEFADIVSGVVCYDLWQREKLKFTKEECRYGYRDSIFKQSGGRYVITSVLLRLSRKPKPRLEYKGLAECFAAGEPSSPMEVREAVIKIRQSKLPDPDETGSAGSFFKNPVVEAGVFQRISPDLSAPHYKLENGRIKIPAAWLIDSCGLKGAEIGGAAVYEKQPLVIVNKSGCASPQEILELENLIINTVRERYGITLRPEVEHI